MSAAATQAPQTAQAAPASQAAQAAQAVQAQAAQAAADAAKAAFRQAVVDWQQKQQDPDHDPLMASLELLEAGLQLPLRKRPGQAAAVHLQFRQTLEDAEASPSNWANTPGPSSRSAGRSEAPGRTGPGENRRPRHRRRVRPRVGRPDWQIR